MQLPESMLTYLINDWVDKDKLQCSSKFKDFHSGNTNWKCQNAGHVVRVSMHYGVQAVLCQLFFCKLSALMSVNSIYDMLGKIPVTGQNDHKPKRPQPKQPQTETVTDRDGHRPKRKRPQTGMATNQRGHRPERPQTEGHISWHQNTHWFVAV